MMHRQLVGRDPELDRLDAFLRQAAVQGESLLLSGAAGVGKTALLNAAADVAARNGWLVLAAGGAELEADLPFAVLHQLLLPVLPATAGVTRSALTIAVGAGLGEAPHARDVAADVLELLRPVAESTPVLLLVDDLNVVDPSTRLVLGVVANELNGLRVGLLAATRDDTWVFTGDQPALQVRPLTPAACTRMLDAHPLAMAAGVRRRVLVEAAGIPLALVELPAALTDAQLADPRRLPAVLPLTDTLRAPFAAAVRQLPESTAQALLLIAVGGWGDGLDLTGPAAVAVAGDIDPAVRAGLVSVDPRTGRAAFRHPMARATVLEQSAAADRRQAHELLAEVLIEQPDRRAWHLAESTAAPDEQIAALLDRAAARAQRSGDPARAVDLFERAAWMSPVPSDRTRRLARSAYLAARVTGELGRARVLLADAGRAGPRPRNPLELAAGAAFVELSGGGDVDTAYDMLIGAVDGHQGSTADPAFVEMLHNLLDACLTGARAEWFTAFRDQLSRVPARAAPELFLRAQLLVPGPGHASGPAPAPAGLLTALEALDRAIGEIHDEKDSTRIVRVAELALSVDRFAACREPLWRLVHDGRAGGAITSAIDALALLAGDGFRTGRWTEAERLAKEGIGLAESHGYQLAAWHLHHTIAMLAAARGDDAVLGAETAAMDRWAGPRGAGAVLGYARQARALGALGTGELELAYRLLAAFGPPGVFDANAGQALLDLIQAAVHTDRVTAVAAELSTIRRLRIAGCSPRVAMLAGAAVAIVSSGRDFVAAFDEALALPGVERWPFDLARVRLAYGARLRRGQAMVHARTELTAALDIFVDLGARPWVVQAETELMATGMTRSQPGGVGPGSLTHQERAVAELAAAGLTNKQIAHRLVISPRTVSAHLRQIFAKLGVSSRASIGDAIRMAPHRGPS